VTTGEGGTLFCRSVSRRRRDGVLRALHEDSSAEIFIALHQWRALWNPLRLTIAATTLRQYGAGDTYTTLPTVSGISNGTTQSALFLTQTFTGISAAPGDPDIAWSTTLASGSLISGSVSGAGMALAVVANGGGNTVFIGHVNPLTGTYGMVVPNGTYTLTVYYQPSGAAPPADLIAAYPDPTPVQVASATTRNLTFPSIGLFAVTGNISGLGSLFTSTNASIVFTSTDNKIQGQFPLDTGGNYSGVLPRADYLASVSANPIQLLPLQTESLELYNIGSLSLNGDSVANYSAPTTVKLTGTLSGGSTLLAGKLAAASITASDTSAPAASPLSLIAPPAASSATADPSGQYQMVLGQNRDYALVVDVPFTLSGTNLSADIHFSPGTNSHLTGDSILNLTIPSLAPPQIMIYGFVTDGAGHALGNVAVTASCQSITGAAGVSYAVAGITDIYGRHSLWLLSGSNYPLTFVPPAPSF
jgi:hypothetical protein